MTAPERSLQETFASMGISIEGGSIPKEANRELFRKDPEVSHLHESLANQFLAGRNEAVFDLDITGVKFLIDQGIGSEFILRVNPKTGKLRPDGSTLDMFAEVDPDTSIENEELRISIRSDKSLIVPAHIDPHRASEGKVNPENVNLVLGSVATLDRGLHTGTKVRTTQPGHNLSVIGANMPQTVAGHEINSLEKSQQAHYTDAKQQRGKEGLIASLSTNGTGKNLLPELTRFGIFSTKKELPAGIRNFQIVIPDFLLQKYPTKSPNGTIVPRSEHRWDGLINTDYLRAGEIHLVDVNDPQTVIGIQEVAFSEVVRNGIDAVNSFTSSIQRGLNQKGW